jgi:uncharacterized membrane protein
MTQPREVPSYDTSRLAALSDGVFAVVLTLLVLDIKVPDEAAGADTFDALAEQGIPFLAWVLSFLVVARVWVIHHELLDDIPRCRLDTIVLNLVLLGLISLLPFASSLVGTTDFEDGLSMLVMSGLIAVIALALGGLARHALTLGAERTDRLRWIWTHHLLVVPAIAAGAAGLAFLSPHAAIGLWLAEFACVLTGVLWTRAERQA